MAIQTTTELVVCSKCGKQRNKRHKPWRICGRCGEPFCLRCINGRMELCNTCWNLDYDEKEAKRKQTPVECQGCHKQKLPDEMENPYVPTVCKECAEITRNLKAAKAREDKKRNARPGLVEVAYGVHQPPAEDGGSGYSYYYHEPLNLGDIVLVPSTWLDQVHEQGGPKEATVVSTYSDYDGHAQSIIRVVKRKA